MSSAKACKTSEADTAANSARWLVHLDDGPPLAAEHVIVATGYNHTPVTPDWPGLDGFTGDLFPRETVGHTGFTGTSFALDPTTGLYVVLLTNRICPSRDNATIYRIRRLVHNAVYAAVG